MATTAVTELLGCVVTSKAGRDRGDRYVVVAALGNDMVLVADGEHRGVERPKRKNVKHLVVHAPAPDLAAQLTRGEALRDEEIRQVLAAAVPVDPVAGGAGVGD